jgi:hypothetical protein
VIAASVATLATAIDIGRDQAHEAAVRELTDPRYAADDPTLVQRILQWVARRISDLVERAGSVVPGGLLGLVLIATAVIGLGFALWFGARAVLRERSARAGSTAMFDDNRPRTAVEHRLAATAAEDAGDHGEAVREWFRAAVRGLEERGLLDPRPGRTADEAGVEIGRLFFLDAPQPLDVARRFDAVTFGTATADADDAIAARTLDERVRGSRPLARA